MRASEALKISYRIARDVPGEIRQCAISDDGFVKHFMSTNEVRNCTLDEVDRWLRGDDWQPLLPAIPFEELPKHSNDLESMGDHMRVSITGKQLRHLVKWEETSKAWAESGDLQEEVRTLRAQLAGEWVLGEPLTEAEWKAIMPTTPVVMIGPDSSVCGTAGMIKSHYPHTVWDFGQASIYLDHRPIPTLAEPEVPAVPPVPRFIGCVTRQDVGEGRIVLFVYEIDGDCLKTFCHHSSHARLHPAKYCRPFDHPEVPNTPELLAALNESEATE